MLFINPLTRVYKVLTLLKAQINSILGNFKHRSAL